MDKAYEAVINEFTWIKSVSWKPESTEILNRHYFLTSKPVIYLINVSSDEYIEGKYKHAETVIDHIRNVRCVDPLTFHDPYIVYSADYGQMI